MGAHFDFWNNNCCDTTRYGRFLEQPRKGATMSSVEPFVVLDCSLARMPTGRSCSNLRELLDAVRTIPDMVIEHHMVRCALEDHFDLYEFPNDFAHWCWEMLGDRVLAEKLGLVDPYQHQSADSLRAELVNVIEERTWELDRVPWCRPGLELQIMGSRLVAYDTGLRFSTPAAMAEALPYLSLRSFFYHMHNARRRSPGQTDDFSDWFEASDAEPALVKQVRSLDVQFLNLNQVRDQIIAAFRDHLPALGALLKVST